MTRKGYFSLLRWTLDPTREEARNVAVLLVDREGEFGGMRAAPVSSISPRLHEQGILDSVLVSLQARFAGDGRPNLGVLSELHESMRHSLYVTAPKPTAVGDSEVVLDALYRAYVSPRSGGSSTLTKGRALDRVVDGLRKDGQEVRRGQYVDDYLFDAIVDRPQPILLEVLSFATTAQKWAPVEHDAGHFLFARERVGMPGLGVVFAPTSTSHKNARDSHDRLLRWFNEAEVPVTGPDRLREAIRA